MKARGVELKKYLLQHKGYYIGFLMDDANEVNHAIAIDSMHNHIYDSSDMYVMHLNDESLDLCVGTGRSFSKFSCLFMLEKLHIEKMKKKK